MITTEGLHRHDTEADTMKFIPTIRGLILIATVAAMCLAIYYGCLAMG